MFSMHNILAACTLLLEKRDPKHDDKTTGYEAAPFSR